MNTATENFSSFTLQTDRGVGDVVRVLNEMFNVRHARPEQRGSELTMHRGTGNALIDLVEVALLPEAYRLASTPSSMPGKYLYVVSYSIGSNYEH